jgi:hypothetical protein
LKEDIIMSTKLTKRILSLTLAGVMAASLSIPAFAANKEVGLTDGTPTTSSGATATEVSGAYKEIEIKVSVPTTGNVQINPYGLPVEITTSAGDPAVMKGKQITSQPMYISNEGSVDLSVGATVTTKNGEGSGITFASAAPTSKSTDKEAFVYLELKQATTTTATSTIEDAENDSIIRECADWTSTYNKSQCLVLNTDEAQSMKGMATLKAFTAEVKEDTSKNISAVAAHYGAGSIVLFRLAGSVVQEPETAWSTDDTFTASIAWSFIPTTT